MVSKAGDGLETPECAGAEAEPEVVLEAWVAFVSE